MKSIQSVQLTYLNYKSFRLGLQFYFLHLEPFNHDNAETPGIGPGV